MSRTALFCFLLVGACCFTPATPTPTPSPVAVASPPMPAARAPALPPPAPAAPTLWDVQAASVAIARACLGHRDRAAWSQERYASWVDMATGPTCRERHVDGLDSLGEIDRCADALRSARTVDPSLGDAAQTFLTALDRLEPLLADADVYYARESYRIDHCAHGRELHPQLVAAFADERAADLALTAVQSEIEGRIVAQTIATLSSDPSRHAELAIERTVDRARRLVRLVERIRIVRGRWVAEDPAELHAAADAYLAARDALARDLDVPGEMVAAASTLSEDARALALQLDAPTSASHRSRGYGSPQRLVNDYNHLVDTYNQL